jgi:hypothetical protein
LSTSYYVWYRVVGDAAAARAAVDEVLREVFAVAGVGGRLLVRRDDPRTWMEVYEDVADTARFEDALAAAARRHDVARIAQDGNRHLEPFLSF